MLRNEGIRIPGLLNIVGMDDPTAKRFGIKRNISEDEILKKFSGKSLTILLKHRPRINEKSKGMFDL